GTARTRRPTPRLSRSKLKLTEQAMSAVMDSISPAAAAGAPLVPPAPEKPLRSERLSNQGYKLSNGASRTRGLALAVLPPLLGLASLVLVWQIISTKNSSFPSPAVTWDE